jgi:hypothetical protein
MRSGCIAFIDGTRSNQPGRCRRYSSHRSRSDLIQLPIFQLQQRSMAHAVTATLNGTHKQLCSSSCWTKATIEPSFGIRHNNQVDTTTLSSVVHVAFPCQFQQRCLHRCTSHQAIIKGYTAAVLSSCCFPLPWLLYNYCAINVSAYVTINRVYDARTICKVLEMPHAER